MIILQGGPAHGRAMYVDPGKRNYLNVPVTGAYPVGDKVRYSHAYYRRVHRVPWWGGLCAAPVDVWEYDSTIW